MLSTKFIERKLGKQVSTAEVSGILTALGFATRETAPDVLTVTVPTWRATKDISLRDDLVEEIGRMIGYGEIVPTPPLIACVPPPVDPLRIYSRRIRREMADQGFTEVYNYSFVNEVELERFELDIKDHIGVVNPIAAEQTHLRTNLLPGLFRNLLLNVRTYPEFRIFELGHEIHPVNNSGLPEEIPHLAALLYNKPGDEADFFELKRLVECLFPGMTLRAAEPRVFEHPFRAAQVFWSGSILGRLFELHPALLEREGIEGRAFLLDTDLRLAQQIDAARTFQFKSLRKYPVSPFDLSVVADLRTPVDQIEAELQRLAGADLAMLDFVRQYAGPPLPDGQKSVSYHLEVGAVDRTLTAEEVSAIRERIIQGLRASGYDLRV